MTYSIDKGYKLGNEGKSIILRKEDFKLKFDRIINTKSGYVCGVLTKGKKNTDVANSTLEKSSLVDVNYFHELLGHFGEQKNVKLRTIMELSCPASLILVQTVLRQKQNKLTFQKVSRMRREANCLGSVSFYSLVLLKRGVLVAQNFGYYLLMMQMVLSLVIF